MSLLVRLSSYWCAFQQHLFPTIAEDLGPLRVRYQLFITCLSSSGWNNSYPAGGSLRGRPQQDRAALARAFIAKAVFQIDTIRALRERLANDRALRRLCGWESIGALRRCPARRPSRGPLPGLQRVPCRAACTRH